MLGLFFFLCVILGISAHAYANRNPKTYTASTDNMAYVLTRGGKKFTTTNPDKAEEFFRTGKYPRNKVSNH